MWTCAAEGNMEMEPQAKKRRTNSRSKGSGGTFAKDEHPSLWCLHVASQCHCEAGSTHGKLSLLAGSAASILIPPTHLGSQHLSVREKEERWHQHWGVPPLRSSYYTSLQGHMGEIFLKAICSKVARR